MKFILTCLQHLLKGLCCGALGALVAEHFNLPVGSELGAVVFICVALFVYGRYH